MGVGWAQRHGLDGPWYQHAAVALRAAQRCLAVIAALDPESPQRVAARAFDEHAVVDLIFESNRIEGAGPSRGETTRIVQEQQTRLAALATSPGEVAARAEAAVSHGGYSRPTLEVARHHLAVLQVRAAAAAHQPGQPLLTEALVLGLHRTLAQQLLPADASSPAGCYRRGLVYVAGGPAFVAAELVPACMAKFVEQANLAVCEHPNAFTAAARVSYDLVRIHPFDDFNGRVSRLLLNLVLAARGLPFAASLRGHSRAKQRYMASLRRADNGQATAYAALVALSVLDSFDELDRSLELANIETIESLAARLPD